MGESSIDINVLYCFRENGELERYARKAKKGVWADPQPVPPWKWRTRKYATDLDAEKCCEICCEMSGEMGGRHTIVEASDQRSGGSDPVTDTPGSTPYLALKSNPTNTRLVLERSPMIFRIDLGSVRINVGIARI